MPLSNNVYIRAEQKLLLSQKMAKYFYFWMKVWLTVWLTPEYHTCNSELKVVWYQLLQNLPYEIISHKALNTWWITIYIDTVFLYYWTVLCFLVTLNRNQSGNHLNFYPFYVLCTQLSMLELSHDNYCMNFSFVTHVRMHFFYFNSVCICSTSLIIIALKYLNTFYAVTKCVIQSDKKGLMTRKYMCSLNNVYLHFCVCYSNSVSFNKISINFYISLKKSK